MRTVDLNEAAAALSELVAAAAGCLRHKIHRFSKTRFLRGLRRMGSKPLIRAAAIIVGASFSTVGCSAASLPFSKVGESGSAVISSIQAGERGPFLYVGGYSLSKYRVGEIKPLRTVQLPSGPNGAALALDSLGNLFVANGNPSDGAVYVFDARTLSLIRTDYTSVYPTTLAVDRNNYVYVPSGGPEVLVYSPGGAQLVHKLVRGDSSGVALAFDRSGTLYLANQDGHSVSVYEPGKTPGIMKFRDRITAQVKFPSAVAVGGRGAGEVFVANRGRSAHSRHVGGERDSITVYTKGAMAPSRRLTEDIKYPVAEAVDSKGRLYVANTPPGQRHHAPGWVTVYAAGASKALRRITDGVNYPYALAMILRTTFM